MEIGNNGAESSVSESEDSQLLNMTRTAERLYFHQAYVDLGTVQLHHFDERSDVLEFLVEIATNNELVQSGRYVSMTEPLLGSAYLYFPVEKTELYYVGETKNDRPDGLGCIFSLANGNGTYDLTGEFLIHYIGEFKKGMFDGYGAVFAADLTDITRTVADIVEIAPISNEVGEQLVQYLFNYVSYEGYFKKNQKEGKGNSFDFPIYDDSWNGTRICFVEELNPPLEQYVFGPVYPNVTVGEYKSNELCGQAKRYKYNYLVYDGSIKNSEMQERYIHYPNEAFKGGGELYFTNIWGSEILYDVNGFFGFTGDANIGP